MPVHLNSSQQVLVKIDVQNAFNCVRRDKLLHQLDEVPNSILWLGNPTTRPLLYTSEACPMDIVH